MAGLTHGAASPLHTPLWSLWRAAVVMLVAMAACGDGFRLYSGYYNSLFRPVVEQSFKAKVETLGAVLKRHVQQLRSTENRQVDLVFLVDSSASVGGHHFREEIKFVRKLLADFTVDVNTTRVAVITFSSRGKVVRQVDHLSHPSHHNHKCSLMVEEMPGIRYVGGGTYTLGAILEAKAVLRTARESAMKAIFLITDGFSNGGDPRPEAKRLKQQGVKIFTFGIRNGNVRELWEMASEPRSETCYVLDSFEEFEALARRALHSDIHSGTYVPQSARKCSGLCADEGYCCHTNATCTCGTHTGTYECLCKPGYYGNGLGKEGCRPCPAGTYKNHTGSGDVKICTPCPDKNQETVRGATLVHECTCKRGFRNFNSTECTVFRCSELRKPENGYFVNNQCDNVFNAACGLRCQPGYELRGSGLRICQEDGSWSGQDTQCVLKTCPALPAPKNGHMVCTTDDFRYPTVCRFTCQAGYQLLGSRKRSCLAIAFWTGITARCREITCPPLPEIRDGVIQPTLCTDEEVPFGTSCQISCVRGYKLRGPPAKQCTPDGTWSAVSREPNQCVDETPPYLHCPENIEIPSDPENDTTEVTWVVPVAVDNSGFIPVLTSDPAVVPPAHLPIGVTVVTYRAEDLSQNVATCRFYVMVVDETPPRIDKCFSPPPVVSAGPFGNVTWEEPMFTDNSGVAVEVVASHSPGELFPQGHTTVTYTAFDSNGNNSTCTIDVQVAPHPCQIPDPPVNGERSCRESEDGVHCTLSCHPGHAFVVNPPPEYFCAYDNVWTPADQMPFPDCAAQHVSNEVLQPASITLTGDLSCTNHKLLNRVEQNIQAKVTDKLNSLCENDVVCELDEIHTTCDDHVDFNKISAVANRRRKRAVDRRRNRASIKFDFTLEGTVNSTGHAPKAAGKQAELSESMRRLLKELQAEAKAGRFDLYLGGRWLKFSDMDFDARRQRNACPEGAILRNNTCVMCPLGMFYNVVHGDCRSCLKGTYQPTEGQLTCMVCPEKTSTSTEHARSELDCRAQCLPGSFSTTGVERCETCLEGFYQPEYAQTKCLPCPNGSTTLRRGTRLKEHCRERCPAGHVSRTGLSPCYPCPFGTYQPNEGQNVCIVCPNLADTLERASTSITQCVGLLDLQNDEQQLVDASVCFTNPCKNGGICIPKDGLLFECKCPRGFEGVFCTTEVNQCDAQPCLNGGTCNPLPDSYICDCLPGFEGQKCQVNINDCDPSPCQNGGTCVDGDNDFTCNCPNGFTGVTCEDNVNDCEDDPCRNGGTCEDDVSGFRCTCPVGFSGLTCEVETDMCLSSPCQNGAVCVDEPGSFRCECTAGFTGKLCEEDVDECASNPCQNGGTCKDQLAGYTCYCADGYSGANCKMDMNAQYQLDFLVPSTLDYAALTIDRPLKALTVSFWMISDDADNYGTAFSYALPNADNTLTLMDYNGFVFYVNQESVVTDVPTNDGLWHHVVITWSTFRGNWKVYMDGLLNDSGFNLSTAKPVPGQGQLVIGQDQDSMGGGFSANEAFVGSITRFNVWDEELSLTTIERMRVSCEKFHGNVVAWPDVQASLLGSLTPQPNSFCRECPKPADIDFGKVSYESLTAGSEITFSCLRGFTLAGPPNTVCLVTGEYELPAPYCQNVNCGNPGSIDNGFFTGWRFNFDDRVHFSCQKGFRLRGFHELLCNVDGEWVGDKPECLEITCPLPPLSENTILSTIQDSAFKPGDSAVFHCSPGHKLLTSHDSVLCQSDGTWDRSVPTCDLQPCSAPPNITDAFPDSYKKEYNVGEIVRYECQLGYALNQNARNPTGALSCLPSNQWGPYEPECVPVECPEPPIIARAAITGDDRRYLAEVVYDCFPGYTIEGLDILECTETGEWDPEPPQCVPADCGEPFPVEHGEILGTDFSFNAVVTYGCERGFTLVGPERRRCDEEAVWEGDEPVCQPVDCGPLVSPANGVVLAPYTTFGEEAVYECDEGYALDGDDTRSCNENGAWTRAQPTCSAVECEPVFEIPNGSLQAPPVFTFGARVLYTCLQGFRMEGKNEMICGPDGHWLNEEPSCLPVECPQPAQPDHGTAVAEELFYTSEVQYTCDPNYRLEGAENRTCEADAAWGGEEPVCVAMTCPTPADLENGALEYKDLTIDSIIRYSCNVGYKLEGVEVRRCQSDLSLSDRAPVCIAVTCSAPSPPQYGSVTLSRDPLLVGSRVTYTCDLGYYIVGGVATRTCSVEGTLSGRTPVCRPVECVKPGRVISNGRMIGSSYTFNSTISYVCDEGYRMEGEAQRVCQANSEWSEPIPVCIVVECPRLSVVNGFASTFSREFGTVVIFSCRARHRLEGSTERTCMANGQWSGEEAVCVKITCPPPLTLENGQSRLADEVTLEFSCNEGFRLEGANSSTCGEDGLWATGAPLCVQVTCPDISAIRLDHGMVVLSENFGNYMSLIQYVCKTGYTLVGVSQRACTSTGQWEAEAPTCQIITCPQPEPVLYGNVVGDVYTYGAEITYACTEGYHLIGAASRRCQADGFWEGVSPRCEMVSCPDVSSTQLVNGIVFVTGNQFGSSIQYSCNPGYTLVGTSQRQCVGRGEWEGVAPTCQINFCPSPPEIFNGVVVGNNFSVGAEVVYECVEGSKLVGNARRRCQADGFWGGEAPRCDLIICPPFTTTLANGKINIVSGFFGGTVEYSCNPGFTLQGDMIRSCNASGAWSGVEPVCVALECSAPPPLEDGMVIGDDFRIGRTVTYRCDEGFTAVGLTFLVCLPNLLWSGSAPLCERVLCPPIPPLQFATAVDTGRRYGDSVLFQCHEGYEMMGVDSVRCQANGAWDAELPECLPVSCGLPPLISNATAIMEDGMLFPANITYVCDTGYKARGSGFSACQANGEWSAASIVCNLVVCPRISTDELQHGSVQVTSFSYGETVGFACNEGYSLAGSSSSTCLAEGFWSAQTPSCEIITCPEPETILNGGFTVEGYTYGSAAIYHCDTGYRLRGELEARCTETGAWSGELRECMLVTCAPPPLTIPNGRLMGIQLTFSYQDYAGYECNEGYELVGSARITCMADGLFDPSPPSCAKIQCPSPGTPAHGSVVVEDDVLVYNCLAGYELVGLMRRPCLSSGQWEGSEPVCIPILCAPPPPVLNGHYQGLLFQFGSAVSYYCDTGYFLRGNRNRTCLAERVWSGEEPVCRRVTCGEPRPVEFAFVIGDDHAYNDTVAYECEPGFAMIGESHRTCLDTGEWSGKSPYCDQILCEEPPEIEHASHDGSYGLGVWGFGSLVMYMCDPGFVMMGASSVLCQEDGTWSQPLPTCPPVTCPALTLNEHSRMIGSDFTFGAVVRFTCDAGYRMDGEESLQCTETGRWSGELPVCHLIMCEIPPIEHGGGFRRGGTDSTMASSLLPGQTADFRCYDGYRIGGAFSTTCLEDGSLTNTLPKCYPVTCGQPPLVTHGSVDPLSGTYNAGDSVSYACDLGYELEGAASLVCDNAGSWEGIVPTCVDVVCDAPPVVQHATVVGADEGKAKTTLAGGWILYRCDDGFALDQNHSGRLSCLRGGAWSSKVPRCVHIDCGPPPVPFYASVTTRGTTAGSRATVLCNSGYLLLATGDRRTEVVCDVSGAWLGADEANCAPLDCRQPPPIPNMAPFNGISTTFGSRTAYRCLAGYLLTGEAEIECTDTGTWDSNGLDPPVCVPVDCQQPPPIPNMAPFNSIGTTFGDRAAYSCLPGYALTGEAEIECTHSATWDRNGLNPASCVPLDCGPPQTDMRVAEGSSFTFGSTVALTCAEGSRPVGSTSVTCTEEGRWSPAPGTCEKILCPVLTPPADGYFTGSSRAAGDSVEILCQDGFARVGDAVVVCQLDGTWSSDVPICEAIRDASAMCEDSIHVENMVVPPDGYFPGDSVVLSCRPGYRPEGDLTSLCEEDLTWATPLGSCVRVSCGQPRVSNPLQVKVFARSTLYGDTAMYMCRPGLTPVHKPPTLTCTASGEWDREAECSARCKRPCKNGGRCVALNMCKCRSGFTGLQCEIPICILPCLNGGVCQGPYNCSCPQGFYGSRCHKAICDRPCQNGGRCLNPNRCQCYNGFKPPFCEKSYFGVIEPN